MAAVPVMQLSTCRAGGCYAISGVAAVPVMQLSTCRAGGCYRRAYRGTCRHNCWGKFRALGRACRVLGGCCSQPLSVASSDSEQQQECVWSLVKAPGAGGGMQSVGRQISDGNDTAWGAYWKDRLNQNDRRGADSVTRS